MPEVGESALHRVAALQRAGSDYVVAVARLRDIGRDDETLRAQGYETAAGVVTVTAEEVAEALGLDEGELLVAHARAVRAALSQRASRLVREERE